MTGQCVALTGGTGFVGKIVTQNLLSEGHSVRLLARNPASIEDRFKTHPNLSIVKGDLANAEALERLLIGADTVIHMAGLTTARNRKTYMAVNSAAVGDLARRAASSGVKRFIYLSSLAAREPHLSSYAASKRAGEAELSAHAGGMSTAIVRSPAVIGAGDKATAPINAAIARGFLPVPGGRGWKTRKLSLVYVEDLASALTGPALSGVYDGQIASPATRAALSWPEFASISGKALGRRVRCLVLPLVILYPVAALTSVSKRLFGRGHLTLEKLNEFLHPDWSVKPSEELGTSLQLAVEKTIKDSYSSRG